MSWIVEEYIRRLPQIKENPDLDDDAYNNAILIEKCITDLINNDKISDLEHSIIVGIIFGFNYSEIGRVLGINRQTVSNVFDDVTDRIAFILGGEFTDAAFLEMVGSLGESISSRDINELFKRGIIHDD